VADSLFRTKSIEHLVAEAEATGEKALKRTLGGWSLVALGIGAIIGAGLFVRTAAAIAERSGPSVTIAFLVARSAAPSGPATRSLPRHPDFDPLHRPTPRWASSSRG
jgi:hypothetical protein